MGKKETASGKSPCAACATGAEGIVDCCTAPFQERVPGIALTIVDVARIAASTGKNPDDFAVILKVAHDDYMLHRSEYVDALIIDGFWISLRGERKCIFLGNEGCQIHDARPLICRMFPVWFEEVDGSVRATLAACEHDCIAVRLKGRGGIKAVLSVWGETEESFKRLLDQYLADIAVHQRLKGKMAGKTLATLIEELGLMKDAASLSLNL